MALSFDNYNMSMDLDGGPLFKKNNDESLYPLVTPNDAMFQLAKVDYAAPAPIHQMTVCNNIVILALTNCHVIRINLENPANIDDIELSKKPGDAIHKIFSSPTGQHLIFSMENGDNYYIYGTSMKPKVLAKMKGHVLESIAFNRANETNASTGEILIGTQQGLIFETEIEPNGTGYFTGREEKYFKQVFNLSRDDVCQPVSELYMEQFPTGTGDGRKFLLLAVTPNRLYQFIGAIQTDPPIFHSIFTNYQHNPEYQEVPGDLGYTQLHLYSKFGSLPQYFAWLTGQGICHGNIAFGSQGVNETVITATSILPYSVIQRDSFPPNAILLTEFHFLVLNEDKLSAVCTLNGAIVFEDALNRKTDSTMKALVSDPTKHTMWCYSEDAIYEITVHDETRYIWRIYLDMKRYDTALQYCKGKAKQADEVLRAQAEHYFSLGKYQLAADYYGRTKSSFEEVALRFLEKGEGDAVKIYLGRILATLNKEDKSQITMLSMWLVEIYLNQLGQLRDNDDKAGFDPLQLEFRKFLSEPRVKESLSANRTTIYDLINSHGHVHDAIYYASLMGDYERVISHYIAQKDYTGALKVLANQQLDLSLVYAFSSPLLLNAPKETVSVWIKCKGLAPRKLIPALSRYTATLKPDTKVEENHAIRYLEYCVHQQGVKDPSIHNYLISLYVAAGLNAELLEFLKQSQHYDQQYALRLCTENNKLDSCVYIYNLMHMYEEAVDLALEVDVDLAKRMASQSYDDEELSKKLWLKIARHVLEGTCDVQKATQLISECDLIKIEEILPFFPDFTLIDHFKDAICNSLVSYNVHIGQLDSQMEQSTMSANRLRQDINDRRHSHSIVSPTDRCVLCNSHLLSQPFVIFPCGHTFHSGCLYDEVYFHANSIQQSRMANLRQRIACETAPNKERSKALGPNENNLSPLMTDLDSMNNELDDIVAADCVLCGAIMIKSIDVPFISENDTDPLVQSWGL